MVMSWQVTQSVFFLIYGNYSSFSIGDVLHKNVKCTEVHMTQRLVIHLWAKPSGYSYSQNLRISSTQHSTC